MAVVQNLGIFGANFLKYVVIMLIMIAVGFLGAFIGVKIRKLKDKKDAAKNSESEEA